MKGKVYLPQMLVIGPQKSGTTWVHDYLSARGDICLTSGVKEPFFFDRNFQRGITWYAKHYEHYNPDVHSRIMEVSPSYFHVAGVPDRVRSTLGAVPVLAILRDPVKRSWSHYLHLLRYGHTNLPLIEAVDAFPEIIEGSLYSDRLSEWARVVGCENVKVVIFEDLVRDPKEFTKEICREMEIPHIDPPAEISTSRSNETAVSPSSAMASIGRKFANQLRSRRFYGVVNFAKNIGLKNIFFGKPGKHAPVNPTEVEWNYLNDRLLSQLNDMQVYTGKNLHYWKLK